MLRALKALTPLGRALLGLALLLAVILALWLAWNAIRANPKAEARLAHNQAEAASQSGSDAVNTVGAAAERERAIADTDRANEAAIRAAPGAEATVSAGARAATLAALCKRAGFKDDPKCAKP